jgi:Na+/proline symporter
MTALDWGVFALYFAGVLGLAAVQSRRNVGIEGYFLANRRLPWFAIGLSVMATQASAITYIGTTGQGYEFGMGFVQMYLGLPIAMVVICILFVPFFYRLKVYTVYEYLESRFDAKTRALASFLFLVSRGLAAGIVLYAPAIVLSVIFGWDETVTVLIMAAVTIAYTTLGGITAVIWTDVVQMLMMFGGIALALIVLFAELPAGVGVGDVAFIGGIQDKWQAVDWSFDLSNQYTVWSGLIGYFFLALAYFGCDQSQAQRFLTARSLTHSRLGLIFNAFLKVPMQVAIMAIGVMLFVFYHFERPPLVFNRAELEAVASSSRSGDFRALEDEQGQVHTARREATLGLLAARDGQGDVETARRAIAGHDARLDALRAEAKTIVADVRGAASNDVNYIFPSYIVQYVPTGLLGLLIAVIFAAAMSSLDSELTALSSATVIDFYKRHFRPDASDAHYLRISRLATFFWGGYACVVALYAGQLGSLIEAVNRVGSYFYGSLLGVFLLAFLVRRATGTGAFVGLLAGMASVYLVSVTTPIAFLWYNVVGAVTVVVVGLAISATGPRGASAASPSRRT